MVLNIESITVVLQHQMHAEHNWRYCFTAPLAVKCCNCSFTFIEKKRKDLSQSHLYLIT